MKRFWFFTLSLALILAACAPKPTPIPPTATPTAVPTPASPFDYNTKVPFDTKVISTTEQSGVNVTELSYAAADPAFTMNTGGRAVATLVSPKGSGPFAGILYTYWWSLGRAAIGRHEYLDEAVTLAQHGAVSLLPSGFFPWMLGPTSTQADRPLLIGQVIELRRAFDFLLAQPGVDPQRLGYVGHMWGADYGGILAAVDRRAKTYILAGGTPSFADWDPAKREQYLPIVQDIDPIKFIPHAAPASLFFQYGKNDSSVTQSLATQYYEAASQPKQIEWYEDTEFMQDDPTIAAQQKAWLIDQLKLTP